MSKNKSPLFFSTKTFADRMVFYIGASHSQDPKDEQFPFLKSKWEEFIKIAAKPAVIVEGKTTKDYTSEAVAVADGGEIAFTTYLARQSKIPVFCFEPDRGREMNWLLSQGFSKEEIVYYYFARNVSQWYRWRKEEKLEFYLIPFFERDKRASGWEDFNFSLNNIKKIHSKLFGQKLKFENSEFFRKIENPTREDNPLKKVVRSSGKFRDQAIIEGIKGLLKNNYDVFVVYGKGHFMDHTERLKDK